MNYFIFGCVFGCIAGLLLLILVQLLGIKMWLKVLVKTGVVEAMRETSPSELDDIIARWENPAGKKSAQTTGEYDLGLCDCHEDQDHMGFHRQRPTCRGWLKVNLSAGETR